MSIINMPVRLYKVKMKPLLFSQIICVLAFMSSYKTMREALGESGSLWRAERGG